MPELLTRLDLRGYAGEAESRLPRPRGIGQGPVDAVREILGRVRAGGDAAVMELTERFDGVRPPSLRVPPAEVAAALEAVPAGLGAAYRAAHRAVVAYHRAQRRPAVDHQHAGIRVVERHQPVRRAGCYVPGGLAPLASTVLMTAVPARVAGVEQVALCSPPGPGGRVATPVLAAAAVAGVDEVYCVGGAQAVAALAYGTETIPPVDVIVGPGNVFVATAQRLVAEEGVVGVPSSYPGPSEVAVVADATTPTDYAAVDLVVQAEHGPGGWAWLVTWCEEAAGRISGRLEELAATSPRRAQVEATLGAGGYCVLVGGPDQALQVVDAVAPEHLELMCEGAEALAARVRNAGAVFCGPWAPASVGDYVAGPSHVLPTARTARFASALGVDDFCKRLHVVTLDRDALAAAAPHVIALAEAEGLAAHADSVRLRTAAPAPTPDAAGPPATPPATR
jgi:histidinol dehydrogenase